MFKNWTKWIPLKGFHFNGQNFLVMARINKITGDIQFKRTNICSHDTYTAIIPELDINEQFNILLVLGETK